MEPMDRRRFLTTAVGALAAVTVGTARASSEFEAYRKARQAEFRSFTGEFEDYKRGLRVAFDQYVESYEAAVKARRRELAAFWPDAEISSPTRWVEYSSSNAIQRIVDFEANEITLSFLPQAGLVNEAIIRRELKTVLATDIASAFEHDPVSRAVERRVVEAAPAIHKKAPLERGLLFSEMFGQDAPKAVQVEALAGSLLRHSTQSQRTADGSARITVPLPSARTLKKAREFLPLVREHSRRWGVDPALVLAIMHTESAFNPLACSHAPAYGLMQIVPRSAGKDATELVYGKPLVVTPSYLYGANNNIRLGTAYLHLLETRYLRAIQDPESRMYCVIAAYNTGVGNVARSYTGSPDFASAAAQINRRSPKSNYEYLVANLPHRETREYLPRVVSRLPIYRAL